MGLKDELKEMAIDTAADFLGEEQLKEVLGAIPEIAKKVEKGYYFLVWRDEENKVYFLKVHKDKIIIEPNESNPFDLKDITNISELAKTLDIEI